MGSDIKTYHPRRFPPCTRFKIQQTVGAVSPFSGNLNTFRRTLDYFSLLALVPSCTGDCCGSCSRLSRTIPETGFLPSDHTASLAVFPATWSFYSPTGCCCEDLPPVVRFKGLFSFPPARLPGSTSSPVAVRTTIVGCVSRRLKDWLH